MKSRIVVLGCLIMLVFGGMCVAGCINSPSPVEHLNNNTIVGTWTVSGTFLANGEICNATFTFKADGTGIREFISPITGNAVQTENLTWNQTGNLDNVKITYEDGYEELASLNWLKGIW